MKYILIILAKSDKQSELVQSIATELGGICSRSDVRYFYTEESIFFSFSTDYNLIDMQNFVFQLFDEMELIYFLSQYNPDKMFTNMSEKTGTYLFNESTLFQKFVSVENNMDKLDEIDNEILEKLTSLKEQFEDFNNKEKQKYKPTLNELLDKINVSGITKLSKEELNLLNEYSKSL